jgi:hypothetical protein
MRMMSWLVVGLVAVMGTAAFGDDAPTTQPDYLIGPMRVQRFAQVSYYYTETQTTLAKMNDLMNQTMPDLLKTISDNNIKVVGPLVLDYHGIAPDPNRPFELRIGFIVEGNPADSGKFRLGELTAFKCADVIYSGPLRELKLAYQQLFPGLFAAGYMPTDETREYYLFWEGPDSVNNIVMVQAGI